MPHRKKHTMRWLRSILAVVLSCLLLCSLLCLYVLHVLERTVVETNTALTAYVQKSVDTRLEELHRYSTTIEITHANTLLKNLRELPGTLPAQAYQLSVTLRDFLVTNKRARGVYLYYPRTGLVVGNMGCFEAASYYALQGVPQREGYDAWLAELTKSHDTRFMLLQMPKDERLCYVREMRMTGETAAVVVIEIDREELLRAFDAAGLPGDSATGVLLDGQLVAATGNMALLEDTPGLYAAWCADPQASPESGGSFATDGGALYCPTAWLLDTYRRNRRYLPRAYLHSLFHCIFRHLWLRDRRDPDLWGLACDIAVEATLDTLNTPAAKRPVGWVRQQCYTQLRKKCKFLAAGPIYRVLAQTDAETLNKWQREFYTDSHRLWPADPDSPAAQMRGKQWENLGRQTELSMEESGRRAGQDTAAQALQAQVQAGRSRRTYRDFLRRFAVWHEEPHLDPEEFDLGFYSYGLRTYGNLPLIEPLESREVKKIRDFVIVVDTSESTAGELVKAFLKETFTLLKSQDSFFRQCRILVMQADNAVRDEVWLNDLDALDRYTAQFTLVGGGGTDFRPAFARIAALRREGSLRDLQGVLYFTDGKGIYPAKCPPFEVAFLFLEDGTPPPDVPPWAMRLVLQPEEFTPDTDPKGR